MDPEPALSPLTVDHHVHAPGNPAGACLAMALASLGLTDKASSTVQKLATPPGLAPDVRALEALQHGAHTILHGPTDQTPPLEKALTAGLHHHPKSPDTRDVLAALEAGRPAIVPTDQAPLEGDGDDHPSCILVLREADDEVIYHDPHRESGPNRAAWETIADRLGHDGHRWMLELAKPPREA